MPRKIINAYESFEQALSEADHAHSVRCLYVTGATLKSAQAIANIKAFCEKYLEGRYELEIIDLNQQSELPRGEQIVAAPMLIKKLPPPLRRLVGDMSDEDRVLVGLQLKKGRTYLGGEEMTRAG